MFHLCSKISLGVKGPVIKYVSATLFLGVGVNCETIDIDFKMPETREVGVLHMD